MAIWKGTMILAAFGLVLLLLHRFEAQVPELFGAFGKVVLLGLVGLFPVWQMWIAVIGGYLATGFFFYLDACIAASGPRGFISNPQYTHVGCGIYILLWPLILVITTVETAIRRNAIRRGHP